ncbi:MAG: hypothetical protein ACE5JH_01015 [Acidobacteriota bacterium]
MIRLKCDLVMLGALACAAWMGEPAGAATRAITPDGAVLEVWETHGESVPTRAAGSTIRFSVSDASGRSIGIVPPTQDPDRDSFPQLIADPDGGSPVLVWSRWDGISLKIAYARFEGRRWSDSHYLTFGPGDDILPRVSTSRGGSFLFWIADGRRYMFAPLDLSAGRLFAPGRELDLPEAARWRPIAGPGPAGTPSLEGNSDVPIWTDTACRGRRFTDRCPETPDVRPPVLARGSWTPEGTSDVPIVITSSAEQHSARWGAASRASCRAHVLAVPGQPGDDTVFLIGFDNGATRLLKPVASPPQPLATFGETAAQTVVHLVCDGL